MLWRVCRVMGFLYLTCLLCVVASSVSAYAANLCGPMPPSVTELATLSSIPLKAAAIEAIDSIETSPRSVLRLSGAARYDTMSSIASVGHCFWGEFP